MMKLVYSSFLAAISGKTVRWISTIRRPRWLACCIIRAFIRLYSVPVDEIEHPVEAYDCLLAFFLRRIQPVYRPLNSDPGAVVCPVDACITAAGRCEREMILLVKGTPYSLRDLLGLEAERYHGGLFIMLYLSPADCHRIYAPCDGLVAGSWFIDGYSGPVYPAAIKKYPQTFISNKRVITELETAAGALMMAKIGALNVGRIPVEHPLPCTAEDNFSYCKGDELGRFEFGSTVVLVFEKEKFTREATIKVGDRVKIGEPIARIQNS